MQKLKEELDKLILRLIDADAFRKELERLSSVYPFSDCKLGMNNSIVIELLDTIVDPKM